MTLIAEDVLLLLLDDTKGTVSPWGNTDAALGGAVLAELAVLGLATVDEKKSIWRGEKVHATGTPPADLDPVLAEALATIAEKDRKASALVPKLGKGLADRLAAGLAERRILERRDGKRLGLIPRTTWPAADTTRVSQLGRTITVCLVDGGRPDERTAALIAPALGRRRGAQGGRAQPWSDEQAAQEARQGDRRRPVGRQGGQGRHRRGRRELGRLASAS